MTTSRAIVLATITLLGLAGCSGGEPFDYVKVTGKVTYEDGSRIPADYITLTFVPQSQAASQAIHPPPGLAEVNVADGTFAAVTSRTYGDGIVPGRHKVLVQAFVGEMERSDAVPAEYCDESQTPLVVHVADAPFELRIRRPDR